MLTDVLPGSVGSTGSLQVLEDDEFDDDELMELPSAPKANSDFVNEGPGQELSHKRRSVLADKRFSNVHGLPSALKRGSKAWIQAVKALPQDGLPTAERKIDPSSPLTKRVKIVEDADNGQGREHGFFPNKNTSSAFNGSFLESLRADCDSLLRKVSDRHFEEVRELVAQMHSLEIEIMTLEADNKRLRRDNHRLKSSQSGPDEQGASKTSTEENGASNASSESTPKKARRSRASEPKRGTSSSTECTSCHDESAGLSTWSDATSLVLDKEAAEDDEVFELWPSWNKREKHGEESELTKKNAKRSAKPGIAAKYDTEFCRNLVMKLKFDEKDRPSNTINRANQNCCCLFIADHMISPSSMPRCAFWDPLSCILVAVECIYIPLQFFPLHEGTFQVVFGWISRSFWTLDIPLSFLTGYQNSDGTLVMQPGIVARKYFKTWFLLDIGLVLLDWVEICLGSLGGDLGAARMGKIMKSLRMLRTFRIGKIIRTVKLPESLSSLVLLIKSDSWKITTSVLRIVFFMMIVNHFLACLWYAIADSSGGKSWVTENDMVDTSLAYLYLTSYHWSLTQFAGAMDIGPVNVDERFFTVTVGLMAFFLASVIVSSITSNMTQWQIISASQSTRLNMLRDFLIDHHISRKLAMKIVRSAQLAVEEQKKSTPEQSIELLTMIPEPMKLELHHELYMPNLDAHPFLRRYSVLCQKTMQGVCHHALSRVTIVEGETLFAENEVAPNPTMYFVLSGKVVFVRGYRECTPVTCPAYLCEPALWTPWFHQGTLVAKKDSVLLSLSAEKFQEVVVAAPIRDYNICMQYAHAYLHALNKVLDEELTDLQDMGHFDAQAWLDDHLPLEMFPSADQRFGLFNITSNAIMTMSTTQFGSDKRLCGCCQRRKKLSQ